MPYPTSNGNESWKYTLVEKLRGIDTSRRPDQADSSALVDCLNVTLKQDKVVIDTGYKKFLNAIRGTPQATQQVFYSSGASDLVLITTDTLYKSLSGYWRPVSAGESCLTTASAPAGQVYIDVDDSTGFSAGDWAYFDLDDGTPWEVEITGTTAVQLQFSGHAIPVGRSVDSGDVVTLAVALNGSVENQVSMTQLPSHNWFVFSNGADAPKRFDGSDCVDIPNLPGATFTCRVVALYNNTLFLMNCQEDGLDHPQRIRRCDAGDPTDWTTGTAGYDDLYDSSDYIVSALSLGPYLIVYRDRSVIRGEYVGTEDVNYRWERTVVGEGPISHDAVVDVGDYHLLIGHAAIFEYRGGFDITPVADEIIYSTFLLSGDVNPGKLHLVFGFYVEELDEVWIFYPTSGSDFCNKLIKYNLGDQSFSFRSFHHAMAGFGFYQTANSRPWSSLVGDWTQQAWKWNDKTVAASSPTTLLCGAETGVVYEYDYLTVSDDGSVIAARIDTKDFEDPNHNIRFDMLEFGLRGDVTWWYSTDKGISWEQLGSVSHETMSRGRLWKQFVTDRIRFRVTSDSTNFHLNWFGFSYKEESIW